MKLPLKTITSLFAIMFLTGCATSPRTHLTNVKNDFFDIARASVAGGPLGLGMNIKATKFLELQYDDYEAYRLGWLGRGLGLWYEESSVRTISTFSFLNNHNSSIHFKFGNTNEQLGSMANTKRGRYGSVDDNFYSTPDEFRLAAYLGYVGADIGVRPLEAVDFIFNILSLGWLDISDDDQHQLFSIDPKIEAIKVVIEELVKEKGEIKNKKALAESVKEVLKNTRVLQNKTTIKKALKEALKNKGVFKEDESSNKVKE